MEQTKCFETLAFKLQTPGNNPEESTRHALNKFANTLYIFQHHQQRMMKLWVTPRNMPNRTNPNMTIPSHTLLHKY
jgi:hypothetical protein